MPATFVAASKQSLSIATTPGLTFSSGSVLTVSAFVKLTDLKADYCILAKDQDSYANGAYLLRYNKDTNSIDWIVNTYTGSFTASVPAPSTLTTASSGTFIVATWVPGGCSVDVNNGAFVNASTVAHVTPEAKQFTGTAHDTVAAETHDFSIGYDAGNPNGTYMNGKIGYVGVWDRQLTAAEITALYASGGGINFAALTTQVADLAAWFELTADANDSTQFGHDLTNNNTATFGFTW